MKRDLLGIMLGDGYISKKGVLTVRHSIKQKEYLMFKYNFCKEHYKGRDFNIVNVSSQNGIQFGLSDKKTFTIWRKLYYPDGKKFISKSLLNRLTKQAIAFWYCDDGSMYFKKRRNVIHAVECVISTCCSKTEAENVCSYFLNTWNIKMTLKHMKGKYSVRFGTKEARKFMHIFGSYIPDCMSYKMDKLEGFKGNWL